MLKGITSQRLVALFVTGVALLNFPLLMLWNHEVQVWGIPLFPLGLFLVWGSLIAALAWVMETGED
jgi:hypothetical protein